MKNTILPISLFLIGLSLSTNLPARKRGRIEAINKKIERLKQKAEKNKNEIARLENEREKVEKKYSKKVWNEKRKEFIKTQN